MSRRHVPSAALRVVGAAACGPAPEAERLARVALSCAVEPGDGTTSSLVRQIGARATLRGAASTEREPGSDAGRSASAEVDPVRQLEQAARCGIRFLVPGDAEWPASLDDLDDAITVQGLGGTPPGLWVRGPMPLTELADLGRRGRLPSRRRSTASRWPRGLCDHLAPVGRARWSRAAPSASTSPPTTRRCRPAEPRSRCWPAGSTGSIPAAQPSPAPPPRRRVRGRLRAAARVGADPAAVPGAQPADRRPDPRHGGRRGGPAQRRAQHRRWAESCSTGRVMCVPGPVTSYTSQGVNNCLRQGRGAVVTHGAEVLELVGAAGEHLVDRPAGRASGRATRSPAPSGRSRVGAGQRVRRGSSRSRACAGLALREHRGRAPAAAGAKALRAARRDGGWRLAPDV